MTRPIAIFSLEGACLYGDESEVVHISNLVHNTQRISFTRIPGGHFVLIGECIVLVASSDRGIEKLLAVTELAYKYDPSFSPMTLAQIEDFNELEYFAYLGGGDGDELKTTLIKQLSVRKYPEMRGSKEAIADLLTAVFAGHRMLIRTNSSEIFEDALFSDEIGLERLVCLSFQQLDCCNCAQITFKIPEEADEQIQPCVIKLRNGDQNQHPGYDLYCEAWCDDLYCDISVGTYQTLTDVLDPMESDFERYIDFLTVNSSFKVEFTNFCIKNPLYGVFIEDMRIEWQAYYDAESEGYSVAVPGLKKTAGEVLHLKKTFKQPIRRKMREIGRFELSTAPPPYVEVFMASRLDLWLELIDCSRFEVK